MTLCISLSPTSEAKLREHAAAAGEPIESLAARIVETAMQQSNGVPLAAPQGLSPADAQRQRDALRAWAELGRPTGHPLDDSRESIYEGRGE